MSQTSNPPDPPQIQLVGRICAVWASLEMTFEVTIHMLARMDSNLGSCVTAQFTSYYPKLNAVIALCEYRGVSKRTIKKLKRFKSEQIPGVAEDRNRIVHDAWLYKNKQIVGKVNFSTRRSPWANEELHSVLVRITKLLSDYKKIMIEIVNELTALP